MLDIIAVLDLNDCSISPAQSPSIFTDGKESFSITIFLEDQRNFTFYLIDKEQHLELIKLMEKATERVSIEKDYEITEEQSKNLKGDKKMKVMHARHRETGKSVVINLYSMKALDEFDRISLRREIDLLKVLGYQKSIRDHVCTIYDTLEDSKDLYIIFEDINNEITL